MIIDFQSRATVPQDDEHIDAIFEDCKGVFEDVVIVGYDKDGNMRLAGSFQIHHAITLLERAKLGLLLGDD